MFAIDLVFVDVGYMTRWIFIECVFISHIWIFIKKYLLLIVINIVDFSEFKCAKGTSPSAICTSPREFLGGPRPNLREVLIWHQTKRASHGPLCH